MRTPAFRALMRTLAMTRLAERDALPTPDAIERLARDATARPDRRTVLKGLAAGATVAALPRWADAQSNAQVAIVGAGLAGLSCADRLRTRGVAATVFEAADRVGGRCFSLSGVFPGQVVERGGELIDNLHKTMIGYAKRFGLTLEDYEKQPGEVFYRFDGQPWPEDAVVDEFREFVAAMRRDLRTLSSAPTADASTPGDLALDVMTLGEYLVTRRAGPVVAKAIESTYEAEFGLEIEQQSALNLLLFIHADRRSRFTPFGIFSDERYHVVEGNDRIAEGLAADLARPVQHGYVLRRIGRTAGGRIALTFDTGGPQRTLFYDYAVLSLPFSVLRDLELEDSLDLPAWKRLAIDELGYGTNAKMMVGFDSPYWRGLGSSGASYSDLPNHQATWETAPTRAGAGGAVLTDYSSGHRGAGLDSGDVQQEAARFLGDLEYVFPGAAAHATTTAGGYRVHLEHWPSNPLSKGSYTCYKPGQFTTIAGNEGKRIANLLFAGEHTNSFYDWQGFMEGACLSGLDAAATILNDLKRR